MFDDVIKLYRNNPSVLSEHPFRVQFEDECAIDAGGVARDMFSGFWCAAAMRILDGGSLLIPASLPASGYGWICTQKVEADVCEISNSMHPPLIFYS